MALTAKKVYAILKRQISDMESKIKTPVIYKGTVTTADLLPLNPSIGDMYNIEQKSIYGEAGMNVAWNGVVWDTMGAPIDMSPYLREDSEIITSLKTKTENLESANYTDRGTLADTDAFLVNDGTGMKKSVLSKLSDFVLGKIADKVFEKLQTNDKTILGAINELNSKRFKANSYIIYSDGSTKTVSVKWGNANSHMTSFLLIDNNRITSLYITGKLSGVTEISKKSEYAVPPVLDASSATLKVTLGSWGTALLICLESVTIS